MMTVVAIRPASFDLVEHRHGPEVMQRIAVPMIGGMISSTILTLIVIPAVYAVLTGYGRGSPREPNAAVTVEPGAPGQWRQAPPIARKQRSERGSMRLDARGTSFASSAIFPPSSSSAVTKRAKAANERYASMTTHENQTQG
jgi:hypothetical protein